MSISKQRTLDYLELEWGTYRDIESWLVDDVMLHYDERPILA
jgi:hypothetical protein